MSFCIWNIVILRIIAEVDVAARRTARSVRRVSVEELVPDRARVYAAGETASGSNTEGSIAADAKNQCR